VNTPITKFEFRRSKSSAWSTRVRSRMWTTVVITSRCACLYFCVGRIFLVLMHKLQGRGIEPLGHWQGKHPVGYFFFSRQGEREKMKIFQPRTHALGRPWCGKYYDYCTKYCISIEHYCPLAGAKGKPTACCFKCGRASKTFCFLHRRAGHLRPMTGLSRLM